MGHMTKDELAELLRGLGIGIGRPDQRSEVAEAILATGHALTEDDAVDLLRHAVEAGVANPPAVLFRWFSSGAWRGVLEDVRAYRRFRELRGIHGPQRGSQAPQKRRHDHYANPWRPNEDFRDQYADDRITYAALGDGWDAERVAAEFDRTVDEVRELVDTAGRKIFGDEIAERWLTRGKKRRRVRAK